MRDDEVDESHQFIPILIYNIVAVIGSFYSIPILKKRTGTPGEFKTQSILDSKHPQRCQEQFRQRGSVRGTAEAFSHSEETIHRWFYEVLDAIMILYPFVVKLPDPTIQSALPRVKENEKYRQYFANCLGALDGIFIPATVPFEDRSAYFNRKGVTSQNVSFPILNTFSKLLLYEKILHGSWN
ncbi:uncharacterized protein EAF01_003740 [Botrytis porri]|uniref:uncharacterized protein n=1 Tax=Botrytis porri TaxID=87229 RepID=UPI00190262F8|nr:uncharacterized protein EAF01_003740 [Botrytis porri]KAF7910022.1 hypothetical protein EAF01_003740 [Botrytis porri]